MPLPIIEFITMRSIIVPFVIVVGALLLPAVQPLAGQTKHILAFGDSITTGLGDNGVTCPTSTFGGYPDRLEDRLRFRGINANLVNFGLCGETTVAAMSRIDSVLATGGEVFLLMEGTNDLTDPYISLSTVRYNLNEMANRAYEAGFEPIMSSVIPRRIDCGTNAESQALVGILSADAAAAGYVFADPYTAFINLPNLYDTYYNDPWHPLPAGYDKLADAFILPAMEAVRRSDIPRECTAGDQTLCLNDERFSVTVEWEKPDGETGVGTAIARTTDTGSFWFFNPDNIELVIKILDGRTSNGHFWVFYGSLSNVAFTITVVDTVTGETKQYDNPQGNFASVGDINAFEVAPDDPTPAMASVDSLPVPSDLVPSEVVAIPFEVGTTPDSRGAAMGTCEPAATHLCLSDSRFKIAVSWRTFAGRTGVGTSIPRTPDTGNFWFFNPDNIELIIKVLDGRSNNGHFWVFFGALSNVEYTVSVVDTVTGAEKEYRNPLSTFASVGDTMAFAVE